MLLYHVSSGSGGMADALDSGSSGSLSCESSSLFFRRFTVILADCSFFIFPRIYWACGILVYCNYSNIARQNIAS